MPTVVVTEDNFYNEVLNSEIPVLVDFWMSRCQPSRNSETVLEQISEELSGKIKIVRINVNDEPDLAYQYKIRSVPTMLKFSDGKVTDSYVGALSKNQLVKLLQN